MSEDSKLKVIQPSKKISDDKNVIEDSEPKVTGPPQEILPNYNRNEMNSNGKDNQEPRVKNEQTSNHVCNVCQKLFTTKYILEEHRLRHTGENRKPCPICKGMYAVLPAHLKTHEKNFTCDVCKESFSTKYLLKIHVARHKTKFPCKKCDKVYNSKNGLWSNIRNIHASKLDCDICWKSFLSRLQLDRHLLKHKGESAYKKLCRICNGKYVSLSDHMNRVHMNKKRKRKTCLICNKSCCSLSVHMMVHHKTKNIYTCNTCKKSFPNHIYLRLHTRIHNPDYKKTCTVCNKKVAQMYQHMRTIHSKIQEKYSCHLCEKSYNLKGNLKRHLRSHTGENYYKTCPICGEKVVHISTHMYKHQAKYTCGECGKTMSKMSRFKHKKMHTRENRKMCEICKETFSNLHHHKRKMHNKQNITVTCDICGKTVSDKYKLKRHSFVHTGQNKQTCPLCNARVCDINKHMRGTHNLKKVKCAVCDTEVKQKNWPIHEKSEKHKINLVLGQPLVKEETEICPICDRKFIHLQHHLRLKHSDKKFRCTLCNTECRECSWSMHVKGKRHKQLVSEKGPVEPVLVTENVIIE